MMRAKLIETVKHPKLGGSVDIRFAKEAGYFFAVVEGDKVNSPDINVVRYKILEAFEQGSKLEWVPVVMISFEEGFRESSGTVTLSYEREWFAKRIGEGWLHASWDTKVYGPKEQRETFGASDRLKNATHFEIRRYRRGEKVKVNFSIPFTDRRDSRQSPTYYLPYTEELWATLKELTKAIDKLQKRIIKVLGDAENRQKLVSEMIGRLALPEHEERA